MVYNKRRPVWKRRELKKTISRNKSGLFIQHTKSPTKKKWGLGYKENLSQGMTKEKALKTNYKYQTSKKINLLNLIKRGNLKDGC